jgi:hypothetical protein
MRGIGSHLKTHIAQRALGYPGFEGSPTVFLQNHQLQRGIDRIDLTAVMENDETFSSFKGDDPTSKLTCENVLVLHRNSIVLDKPTMLMSNAPS